MSSALGNVVNSTTVGELPLNGRDWSRLATLESGVNTLQTQVTTGFTAPRGNRGFGAQLTISDTRPQMNNYRLDGISIVDYSGGSPGSVLGITLGVDAVGEFSVITSNYSAEYGRTSGGILNAVTKSDNNKFHGDAYWFIRDDGFDARSYFWRRLMTLFSFERSSSCILLSCGFTLRFIHFPENKIARFQRSPRQNLAFSQHKNQYQS